MTETEKAREEVEVSIGNYKMARPSRTAEVWEMVKGDLDAYAAAIRAEERERCAKVCANLLNRTDDPVTRNALAEAEDAIRALSPTEVPNG